MQPQPVPHRVLQDGDQISMSHFTHVLQRYRNVIILTMSILAVGYFVAALALFLLSRTERVTIQRFRLDFEGAGDGHYPNRTKFSVADIVSEPILSRVYKEDGLDQYLSFAEFSRSTFVLEANREFERLAAEYQAKLFDARLSAVDRERLQQEFDLKLQSIVKNEYAIHFSRRVGMQKVPETVARKVLLDILNNWADFQVRQQHVTSYQVSVLTPQILEPSEIERRDLIAGVLVLRGKINRAVENVDLLNTLPSASQARTPSDNVSLEEIRLRLEEIIRFRLEPLVPVIFASRLVPDRPTTVRFLQSQLDYDRRQLQAKQSAVDAARQSLAAYERPSALETTSTSKPEGTKTTGESVTPVLSENFLDRLVTLTSRSQDVLYRQRLIDEYRKSASDTIPLQQAVAYDTEMLNEVHAAGPGGTVTVTRDDVLKQLEGARKEAAQLVGKMNELFQTISKNMTPSAQLFTPTAPPETATMRAYDPIRLALYGLLGLAIALPMIILICLLHNRVREEEAVEMIRESDALNIR